MWLLKTERCTFAGIHAKLQTRVLQCHQTLVKGWQRQTNNWQAVKLKLKVTIINRCKIL